MKDILIHCKEKIIETGQVFAIDDDRKTNYAKLLRSLDTKWGFSLPRDYLNNYDHNDYLVVANLLQSIRNTHSVTYYNPVTKEWVKNNSEIPYIHLEFIQEAVSDKGLNTGVKEPLSNGSYKMFFNYYWLQQYIGFLQKFFDSNEELFVSTPEEGKSLEEYTTYDDLIQTAAHMKAVGASLPCKALLKYAECVKEDKTILNPVFCDLNCGKKVNEPVWGFYDKDRNGISIPLKQHIYNTSGFASLFYKRNAFISDVFFYSLKFILGHEVAHVARGHWNLRVHEPDYSLLRDVSMNCEINADWTSAYWLLNKFIYDTLDEKDPYSPVLRYTKNELIYAMSVMIFSCYLSLSWAFCEDREWSDSDLNDFINNMTVRHPVYNFRVYNILGKIHQHIHGDFLKKDSSKVLQTKDGANFGETAEMDFEKSMDMILSFESAFKVNWEEDTRDTEQKLHDSLYYEASSCPNRDQEIPFMMTFRPKAQQELERYEQLWPETLEKLKKYGMYYTI